MTSVALKTDVSIVDVAAIRADGGTQPRAAIYQNVIDDYADALGDGAVFPPVVVFYDGTDYWLADGFHRHAAHKKTGLAEIGADIRQGTRRDAVLYSVGANSSHGLRRTNEDKRRAVLTLLRDEEWVKWSDREIARRAGVDNSFVSRLRKDVTVDEQQLERTYTTRHGTVATMATANIGRGAVTPVEIRQSSEPAPAIVTTTPIDQPPQQPANDNDPHNHRAQGTGDNQWYTPAQYIDLARRVLGTIDVDPASNEIAQATVKASKFYTEETNGLDKPWVGKVWLNPPYSRPAISHFADKTIAEVANGNAKEAIVLTHNYTDTAWHQGMSEACSAICFTRGRIRFESPAGEKASPTQGQTFFYFGENVAAFRREFSEIGVVWVR